MHAAAAFAVAAACLVGSAFFYRHRDGVLRFMTRFRGYERTPPGPRRRYQRGAAGNVDMLSPSVGLLLLAMIMICDGLLALR